MVGLLLRYDYERSSFIRLKEKEVFVDIRIICCTTSLRIEIIVDMPSQHLPEASIFLLLLTLSACHSPMYLYCWEKKNIFRYAMPENRSRCSRTLPITGRGGEVLSRMRRDTRQQWKKASPPMILAAI